MNLLINLQNVITIQCFRMTSVMDNVSSTRLESKPELSEIQSFYKDSTVFLTGATGFMGSLILEKIIR